MFDIEVKEIRTYSETFKAGDEVLISGTIYTARDAAHSRLNKYLDEGKELPINLMETVLYYAGPTPAPKGFPIGSVGPTTSSRMDGWTPRLLNLGLLGMIGKGQRSADVITGIRANKVPYFIAVGGAGALYAKYIKRAEVVAFGDLGCEAIHALEVERFPVFVGIDCHGGSLFKL